MANYFEHNSLISMCIETVNISDILNTPNVFGLIQAAKVCNDMNLLSACNNYVDENFLQVFNAFTWLEQSNATVKNVISSTKLNVYSEKDVFQAITTWIDYDFYNRNKFMPTMLDEVRLPLMETRYVEENVSQHPAVRDSLECMRKLFKAQTHKLDPDNKQRYSDSSRQLLKRSLKVQQSSVFMMNMGFDKICVYEFLFDKKEWRKSKSLSFPVENCGTVMVDNMFYVFGGSLSSSETSDVTEKFNCDSKQWYSCEPMLEERSCFGVCSVNDKIYAFGGKKLNHVLKTCEVYDCDLNTWKYLPSMSKPNFGSACVYFLNSIWVLGGVDNEGCVQNSTKCFDPKNKRWSFGASLIKPRVGHGAIATENKIFVLGGSEGIDLCSTTQCEYFDAETKLFTYLSSPMLFSRCNFSVARKEDLIYVFGGYRNIKNKIWLDSVEVYDLRNEHWIEVSFVINSKAVF